MPGPRDEHSGATLGPGDKDSAMHSQHRHVSSSTNDESYGTLLRGGPVTNKSVANDRLPSPDARQHVLTEMRQRKIAHSSHA